MINVTPLIDVCLVLLLIYLILTPAHSRPVPVTLPQVRAAEPPSATRAPLLLTIDAERRLWLGREPVSAIDLSARLAKRMAGRAALPLVIEGDAALTYGDVRRVLDLARAAQAPGVELAVEQTAHPAAGQALGLP